MVETLPISVSGLHFREPANLYGVIVMELPVLGNYRVIVLAGLIKFVLQFNADLMIWMVFGLSGACYIYQLDT